MKAYTPEISWHNHGPILCLDVQHQPGIASADAQVKLRGNNLRSYRLATGGNDQTVYIWMVSYNDARPDKIPFIEVRAALRRHQKTVGCLRFSPAPVSSTSVPLKGNSPQGKTSEALSDVSSHQNEAKSNASSLLLSPQRPLRLASGDDDGYIIIWQYESETLDEQTNGKDRGQKNVENGSWEANAFGDDNIEPLETWKQHKALRGHLEDVCDLCWSKDGSQLFSGSIDNSAIVWDVDKGVKLWMFDGSRGFVHGVAFDPHNEYVAAISSDRNLRIYDVQSKKLHQKFRQSLINYRDISKCKATFIDDTLKSFCRRLEFSPCGEFILVPSGTIQMPESTPDTSESIDKPEPTNENANQKTMTRPQFKDAAFLFRRNSLGKPCCYYPTGNQSALCVRFCPVYFKLRNHQQNLLNLPYRIVFAIATSRSILIYDTQQTAPIGYLSQIHLARLTDLSWSADARLLMISSYDAYSTFITFDADEFGEPYNGPTFTPSKTIPEIIPPRPRPAKIVVSPPVKSNTDKAGNQKLTKWLTVSPKAPPTKRLRES